MSWLFSRGLAEDYLARMNSGSTQCALPSWMTTVGGFLCKDRTRGIYPDSQSGVTFEHLTAPAGEELLTSYLADSRVRHLAPLLEVETLPPICGRKCAASYPRLHRPMCLPRTSPPAPSTKPAKTSPKWVTPSKSLPFPRKTWVQTTSGPDFGYLHTPTTKANYAAPSMQKWPACRNFVAAFGKPSPNNHEWLMGWPAGWTDTAALAMGRFQSWRQRLCGALQMLSGEE